jgi:serine/threonine protein kinase
MLAVGRQLGPYTILAPLGAGGMGEVYKAKDTRLNHSVAIKVLPADKVSDRERHFIPEPSTDRKSSIQFLSFATGKVKTFAPMSGPPMEGLSVSPDGRFLLFSQRDEAGSGLMPVENFR